MSAETNGVSFAEQLDSKGVQLGWETRLVPFGKDISATVYSLGFANRAAMSFGAVLLAAGTKGKRFALPNARIMIHQPIGGIGGQATDIQIHAKEILGIKVRLNEILSKHTGQPVERIVKDSDRNFFMTAEQALEYGIIDEIIHGKRERK